MNKIEFKELNKEQMIIAFNQLKDDYHNVFEENENLKSVLKEIREYIKEFTFEPLLVCEDRKLIICNQNLRKLEEIIDKGIGENNG